MIKDNAHFNLSEQTIVSLKQIHNSVNISEPINTDGADATDNPHIKNASAPHIGRYELIPLLKAKQDAGYLFRGEPEQYPKVISGLRRIAHSAYYPYLTEIMKRTAVDYLKIRGKEINQTNLLDVQAEIQHYGGKTNLIDFTDCYHVAMFFACNKYPVSDGRIVMMHPDRIREDNQVNLHRPKNLPERARKQKSVLIECHKGILPPKYYDVISIQSKQKMGWVQLLRKLEVNEFQMFPDIIGFIKINEPPIVGLELLILAEQQILKSQMFRYAIKTCQKAINDLHDPYIYHLWGIAHLCLGETQNAVDKFNRAITLDDYNSRNAGKLDTSNGAYVASWTARNLATNLYGTNPRKDAIASINHHLGKGNPMPPSGNYCLNYGILPMEFQRKRWQVLNVFFSYGELWDALPQLATAEEQDVDSEFAELQVEGAGEQPPEIHRLLRLLDGDFYRKLHEDDVENPLVVNN